MSFNWTLTGSSEVSNLENCVCVFKLETMKYKIIGDRHVKYINVWNTVVSSEWLIKSIILINYRSTEEFTGKKYIYLLYTCPFNVTDT